MRRLVLDAVFWTLAQQLGRSGSGGLNSTVRCHVVGGGDVPDSYELRFRDGGCRVVRGARERKPELTLTLDDAELVRLVSGQSTPAEGVFNGRITVRGDVGRVAAAMASVFLGQPRD